jgi:ATP-dependent Clp protease ATP-binding subunit ClpC
LTQEHVIEIVDLQMHEIAERLGEHGVSIELTQAARVWLAEQGYDPAFGARPLRRTLQKQVESPLSVKLLRGEFKESDVIVVDHNEDEGLIFVKKEELVVKVPAQEVEVGE